MLRRRSSCYMASVFLFAALMTTASAQSPVARQRADEIQQLNWVRSGSIKLRKSHSTIVLPANHFAVTGQDARRLMALIGNSNNSTVEAVIFDKGARDQISFESFSSGYISLSDWDKVDPMEMISQIQQNTEKANVERRQQGFPDLHVIGWLQKPTLDRNTDTAYWAIDAKQGDDEIVNAIALRLNRNGFEKLTWVTDKGSYFIGHDLDVVLRTHSFDLGYRYADHVAGDKVAAYGIAGLIAAVAGVKLAKVAAAGGLLLLFKKIGAFVVAGAAAVLYRIKKLFRKAA